MSNKSSKINIKSVLNITLRLFVVCTIIAAVVAGVNSMTKDKIEANEKKVTDDTIRAVFSEGTIVDTDYEKTETSVNAIYKIIDEDSTVIGYSVICAPSGFGGEVKMMVAFDDSKAITAVRIMSHSETPGIGDKITSGDHADFRDQFAGKNTELSFGNGVDKISGSTKSSNAVLKGVNDAIAEIANIN